MAGGAKGCKVDDHAHDETVSDGSFRTHWCRWGRIVRSPLSRRVARAMFASVVGAAMASTVLATADAQDRAGDHLEAVAFDATDGAQIEQLLEQVGLGAAWRAATGLSEPPRALAVRYDDRGSEIVGDLVNAAANLESTNNQHKVVTARLRQVARDELAAQQQERDRLIERNRAGAHLRGMVNLLRSVAIQMFAGNGESDDVLLGLDGPALRNAQRTLELRGHTLEEMIDRRAAALEAFREATDALDVAVAKRLALEATLDEVRAEARDLTRARHELDQQARAILPEAAEVFSLASVPGDAALSPRAVEAYMNAELVMTDVDPACRISWRTIAAVGAVEGAHGNYGLGDLQQDGTSIPRIVGVALDGVNIDNAGETVAVIADTDNGLIDGDAAYDRAVGPMQFIPETWSTWAMDGDGDGEVDPFDLDDAAVTTAAYLCSYGSQRSWENWKTAVFGYNHSAAYVASVKSAHDRIRRVRIRSLEGGPEFEPAAPWGTYVAMAIPDPEGEELENRS